MKTFKKGFLVVQLIKEFALLFLDIRKELSKVFWGK